MQKDRREPVHRKEKMYVKKSVVLCTKTSIEKICEKGVESV